MSNPTSYFQAGGSLTKEAPSYVERKADQEIYDQLKAGKFCYVLTARQMGKSSLKVRTRQKLQKDGYSCANVDITEIGISDSTVEQWYFSFLYTIAEELDLEDEMED